MSQSVSRSRWLRILLSDCQSETQLVTESVSQWVGTVSQMRWGVQRVESRSRWLWIPLPMQQPTQDQPVDWAPANCLAAQQAARLARHSGKWVRICLLSGWSAALWVSCVAAAAATGQLMLQLSEMQMCGFFIIQKNQVFLFRCFEEVHLHHRPDYCCMFFVFCVCKEKENKQTKNVAWWYQEEQVPLPRLISPVPSSATPVWEIFLLILCWLVRGFLPWPLLIGLFAFSALQLTMLNLSVASLWQNSG